MVIVGAGAAITSGSFISLYSYFSTHISGKIKVNYFRACLAKDGAYFDEHNTN